VTCALGWAVCAVARVLVTGPQRAGASSVLVGMGFERAAPEMADNASATAIESVSFEDVLASFLAGSVPAHRFVLHQFAACFMRCSLGAGSLPGALDPTGNRLPSTSAGKTVLAGERR